MGLCARVAVQRPINKSFHYLIPDRIRPWAVPGARCIAPFGRGRAAGVILSLDEAAPVGKLKEILDVLDMEPLFSSQLLSLGVWLSSYYRYPIGETFASMFPPGLYASEKLVYRAAETTAEKELSAQDCVDLLKKIKQAGDSDVSAFKATEIPVLQQCLDLGLVVQSWKKLDGPSPRGVRWYSLAKAAPELPDVGRSAPRQAQALEALKAGPLPDEILRARGVSMPSMKKLVEKGWATESFEPSTRDPMNGFSNATDAKKINLTQQQTQAVNEIMQGLEARRFLPILLHGITGSGKTEVYIRAAAQARKKGLGALMLVPEISLTPQMLARFYAAFGEEVAILHSGLSKLDRSLQWGRVRSGQASIVLGTRSAVFAPIEKLGLVVVDEEHESSYKQEDGLRYNAKHAALMRAREANAVAVLGSATPDVETLWAAHSGKYKRISMPNRVLGAATPSINIVDVRQEEKRRRSQVLLSEPLRGAVDAALKRKEQALLFLNRRGFSPALVCRSCGEALSCKRCSISLTYHKTGWVGLLCHYCGTKSRTPALCPMCGEANLAPSGIGTQRVMDEAIEAWPQARIARLDGDVARKVGGLEVLGAFRRGEADILVGTQMVAKGHHFPRLTVVGVVDSDTAFHLPDFRAGERGFQMLFQVAGRAGREDLPGFVFLQTRTPNHPIMKAVASNDYDAFASQEINARRDAGFPPFRRIAVFKISSKSRDRALEAGRVAAKTAKLYAAEKQVEVLGPAPSPIEKIRDRWRCQVFLRAPGPSPGPLQAVLEGTLNNRALAFGGDIRFAVDIDPLSLL